MSRFLGLTREPVFSPGKVDADRLILTTVAGALRERGYAVDVIAATEIAEAPAADTVVFTMAQGERALAVLAEWERAGIRVINSVAAVLNCHRYRMVERFEAAGIAAPATVVLGDHPREWPAWLAHDGGWLKRGDVHATEPGDVVFVRDAAAADTALAAFQQRGLARAVLQRHVTGRVVKFYAVGAQLLGCFPADGDEEPLPDRDVAALAAVAATGARALGLDVYGGDCVVDAQRGVSLIDLNDWPSYAPCRVAAAGTIATQLEAQSV